MLVRRLMAADAAAPAARNIVAAALCLTGVGFVSLGSGLGGLTIGTGDLLTLLCA